MGKLHIANLFAALATMSVELKNSHGPCVVSLPKEFLHFRHLEKMPGHPQSYRKIRGAPKNKSFFCWGNFPKYGWVWWLIPKPAPKNKITPKIAFFDPNFTLHFPKSHKNPGVGKQIWETSPQKYGYILRGLPLIFMEVILVRSLKHVILNKIRLKNSHYIAVFQNFPFHPSFVIMNCFKMLTDFQHSNLSKYNSLFV